MRVVSVLIAMGLLVAQLGASSARAAAGAAYYTDPLMHFSLAYPPSWLVIADSGVKAFAFGPALNDLGPVFTAFAPDKAGDALLIFAPPRLFSAPAIARLEHALFTSGTSLVGAPRTQARRINGMAFQETMQNVRAPGGQTALNRILLGALGRTTYFLAESLATGQPKSQETGAALAGVLSSFRAYALPAAHGNPALEQPHSPFVPWLGAPLAAFVARYGSLPQQSIANVLPCPHDRGRHELEVTVAQNDRALWLALLQCPSAPKLADWHRTYLAFLPPDAQYVEQVVAYGDHRLHYRSAIFQTAMLGLIVVPDFTVVGNDHTNEWSMEFPWSRS